MRSAVIRVATTLGLACLATSVAAAEPDTYALVGATVHTMVAGEAPLADATLIVEGGRVRCIAATAAGTCTPGKGLKVFALRGGVVLPGMVDAGTRAGLVEISLEPASGDGRVRATRNAAHVRALDGIHMNSRLLDAARRGGVTALVSHPLGHALLSGQSVAFVTRGKTIDDALIEPSVAVHCTIGTRGRGKDKGIAASQSGQVAALRRILDDAKAVAANPRSTDPAIAKLRRNPAIRALIPVVQRRRPLAVHAQRADAIAAAVRLAAEVGVRIVIIGGAEAHVVAASLARAKVPVILAPIRARPYSFETLRARDDGAARLHRAGVQLALSTADDHLVRNLRWQAGWAVAAGLPHAVALRAITSDPARILGLPAHIGTLKAGAPASLVAFDADPLSIRSKVALVAVRGVLEVAPKQR